MDSVRFEAYLAQVLNHPVQDLRMSDIPILPCRQMHEWRQLTRIAALPIRASEQLRGAANAQQLQKGLAWEMRSGYVNSQV